MLNLWRIKCHVIPHCCPRNPSLEFLICRSISKRFYLHWKAFYLLSNIRYILIMGGGTAGSLWHHQTRTCQPPEFKNLEMSWNLCINCKNIIFDNVGILSENHPKAFRMFLTLITACENHANFLTCIVQFDWLISNQIQFDCSVLFFPIENSSNKSTKSSSFFILLFDISEIMKLMKHFWKRPR